MGSSGILRKENAHVSKLTLFKLYHNMEKKNVHISLIHLKNIQVS